MVGSKLVVTTDSASALALESRLEEAWEHLRRAAQPVEQGSPRAQLLAQPWTEIWQIEESTTLPTGIADSAGEFLIMLRDVGAYLADKWTEAMMTAAAERLVEESVLWLKRRYGADSIELNDQSEPKKKRP